MTTRRLKKRLGDSIHLARVKSVAFENTTWFLPEDVIGDLITRQSITETLWGKADENDNVSAKELVDFILTRAKKAFAITLQLSIDSADRQDAMQILKDVGISDRDLPIQEALFEHRLRSNSVPKPANGNDSDDDYEIWDEVKIDQFCQEQWIFLAPVFSTEVLNYDLSHESVLPFIEKSATHGEGGFSEVYKYKIHECHFLDPYNPGASCPEFVAVKKIRPQSQIDRQKMVSNWGKEAEVLSQMNMLKQKHIVRFLTAFRHGIPGEEEYYLMFEWAGGGNLRNLWHSYSRPHLTATLVKKAFEQLVGLAEALALAHDPNGNDEISFRHGDLKPENILWFTDDPKNKFGTLKIGDWGLAKKHNLVTHLRTQKTSTGYGTRRYEPPEEETAVGIGLSPMKPSERPPKRRSRLYDMWSMGCIAFELLIWLMYGLDGLRKFDRALQGNSQYESTFYEISVTSKGERVAEVHKVVIEWMKHMKEDPVCQVGTTALGNLHELIETRLLVVKLPQRLGTSRLPTKPTVGSRGLLQPFQNDNSNAGLSASIPIINITEDRSDATLNSPRVEVSAPEPDETPPAPELSQKPIKTLQSPAGWERAIASAFRTQMLTISGEDEGEAYWFQGQPGSCPESKTPVTDIQVYDAHFTASNNQFAPTQRGLHNEWNLFVDNDFANHSLSAIQSKSLSLPDVPESTRLCAKCQQIPEKLWSPGFSIIYQLDVVRANSNAKSCDLCAFFWRACERQSATKGSTVMFQRVGTSLTMNGAGLPAMSIFRNPDMQLRIQNEIQIGFPKFPEGTSQAYFEVIKQWLKYCDCHHQSSTCAPRSKNSGTSFSEKRLPTRVIAVGKEGDDLVHVQETAHASTGTWVALSHQWGPKPHFCTTRSNLTDHVKGIRLRDLPATFRDAVIVTRALGISYLWIDSICILQGPDGDFRQEAKRMEQVYSGAYCVLASSRAPGHDAGFLQPRKDRDAITLRQGESQAPFYICEASDDFESHVVNGTLNQRGWVLQEHALARRTVYFTDHQTYFECGDGVRCETMSKMSNETALFLGDPSFPELIIAADQGEKILRYQELYQRYSRLGLSHPTDRAMAIDGLQERILDALGFKGGFGIFDQGSDDEGSRGFLRRSLLWCRGSDTDILRRIQFPSDRLISVVPSWSWMAYTGGIDYISPDFGAIKWERMQSPWSSSLDETEINIRTDVKGGNVALKAEARDYNVDPSLGGQGKIVFDTPGTSQQPETKCVILGKQQGRKALSEKTHYLLIVKPKSELGRDGNQVYERVGAGFLPGKYISTRGSLVTIH